MLSNTEENYIKAIYGLEMVNTNNVSTTLIAEKLKTKASSVTDMLKKLAEKKLINYQKYKGVTLTETGKKSALFIIRKHRLWEVFLVDKLDYKWDEVHEIAEQLEHIQSDSLIDRLDNYLNFPEFDPHGDPIPTKNGQVKNHNNTLFHTANINGVYSVIGVKDSSKSFLNYLDSVSIEIGSELKINSIGNYDNSIVMELNEKTITISQKISQNLFVKKLI